MLMKPSTSTFLVRANTALVAELESTTATSTLFSIYYTEGEVKTNVI
jgi:hypothetical protein